MSDVKLWELVRDWVNARYKHVKVVRFSDGEQNANGYPTGAAMAHLGRITVSMSRFSDEIGFIGPKGVLVWPPGELGVKRDYVIFNPTDPQMFEKLDAILVLYESQRPE